LECGTANFLEVFVADDAAFEGVAEGERQLLDDFEIVGEGDTREGAASSEHFLS